MKSNKQNNTACWMFFCKDPNIADVQETGTPQEAIDNILNGTTSTYLINNTENMVKDWLKTSISTSQLRKIFNEIKKTSKANDLQNIRPILSYTIARQNNFKARNFMEFLQNLVLSIKEDDEKYNYFLNFVEATISYHKYYTNK